MLTNNDIQAILREGFDKHHAKLGKMDKHDQVNHLILYENQYDSEDTIIPFIANMLVPKAVKKAVNKSRKKPVKKATPTKKSPKKAVKRK